MSVADGSLMSRGYRIPIVKLDRARVLRGWSKADLAVRSGVGLATVARALSDAELGGDG